MTNERRVASGSFLDEIDIGVERDGYAEIAHRVH